MRHPSIVCFWPLRRLRAVYGEPRQHAIITLQHTATLDPEPKTLIILRLEAASGSGNGPRWCTEPFPSDKPVLRLHHGRGGEAPGPNAENDLLFHLKSKARWVSRVFGLRFGFKVLLLNLEPLNAPILKRCTTRTIDNPAALVLAKEPCH